MRDSIEIYSSIRRWENLRTEFINNMRTRQVSLDTDFNISDIELKLRNEMKKIEISFFQDSTDVEFIVTNTFPKLKKSAWYENYYIEENKIEFQGYEYMLFKDKNNPECFLKNYSHLEDVVNDIIKYTNSTSTVDLVLTNFYF